MSASISLKSKQDPSKPAKRYRRRINKKGVIVLAALLAGIILGSFPLRWNMDRKARTSALEQSKVCAEGGDYNLAIRHLNQFLDVSPVDIPVLEAKAKLLAEASRSSNRWILDAAKLHDQLIRLDPSGKDRLETRRKLADLYIRYSDIARRELGEVTDSSEEVREFRYQAAVTVLQELLRIEGESTPPIEDGAAHRLLAMASMGQLFHFKIKAKSHEDIPVLLGQAKAQLLEALRIDPRDLIASEKLAELYLTQLNDPAAAEKTLDGLLATMPGSVEVRLARYRVFTHARKDKEAKAELDAAIELAPEAIPLRLHAASDALGRRDAGTARRHLDAIPAAVQKEDLRVKVLRGQVDFAEQHPDDAIDQWRQGLSLVSGANAELTWQLASSTIRLGGPRLGDALPLINQYLRLSGEDKDRKGLFLQAMYDQRAGHPSEAIEKLEKVVMVIPKAYLPDARMILGNCYQSIGEDEKAILSFTKAANAAPTASAPCRAIARINLARNPERAIAGLERALESYREKNVPEDPGILFDLIRIKLGQQLQLPADRRRWKEIEDLLDRAGRARNGAAEDANFRGLHADYLYASNQAEAAFRLLDEATKGSDRKLPAPWAALASLLDRQNRRADAIKVLDQGMAGDAAGDHVSLRVAKAQILLKDGKGQAAREVLARDHSSIPPSELPELYRVMGSLLRGLGDREGARACYVEWVRLVPESTEPARTLLNFAEAYGDDAAAKQGIEALRSGRRQNDPYALAAQALELLRSDRGHPGPPPSDRLEQAERLAAELNRIAPSLSWKALIEGRIQEYRGNLRDAAKCYRKAASASRSGPALPRLIEVYMKLHDDVQLENLETEHENASLYSPAIAKEFAQLAFELARKLGDRERMEYYASRLAAGKADSIQAAIGQARLLISIGKASEAEFKLQQLVETRPQEPSAWFSLIEYQSAHQAASQVAKTIDEARRTYRGERPELFLARCYSFGNDKANAARLFEIAGARWPDDLDTIRYYVEFCMKNGQEDRVEGPLRRALKIDPAASWAAMTLALQLTSKPGLSNWDEAWKLVTAAGSASGDSPEGRVVRATVLARSPDSARRIEAVKAYAALVNDLPIANPLAVDSRVRLSQTLLEINKPDEAWTSIAPLAEDLNRANPAALAIGIEALARSGRGDEAQRFLGRLAKLAPGSPQEPILRAWVLMAKGKKPEASATLRSAFASAENTPEGEFFGLSAVELMIRFGDSEGALEAASKLAARWPRDAWILARVQVIRKETDQALASCRIALEAGGPVEAREAMRHATSAALIRQSDPSFVKQVEVIGRAARARSPADPDILVLLATVDHLEGRYRDEIANYEQALKLNPTDFEFLNNMAWTLSEGLGRHQEALKSIEDAIRRVGPNPDYLDTRGVIQGRLGNDKEAIADLELSIKGKPLATTYFHLAQVYLKAGNLAEWRRCRDLAWKAKFDPERLDPTDRTNLAQVMGTARP